MPKNRIFVCLLLIFSGTACQNVKQETLASAEMREQATQQGTIEIKPLQDPAVLALYQQAQEYEKVGKTRWAVQRVRQAMAIAPNHPELLQYLAELMLNESEYDRALAYANDSWRKGPKVGSLCSRNWLTIAHVYQQKKQAESQQHALDQAKLCHPKRPKRM